MTSISANATSILFFSIASKRIQIRVMNAFKIKRSNIPHINAVRPSLSSMSTFNDFTPINNSTISIKLFFAAESKLFKEKIL